MVIWKYFNNITLLFTEIPKQMRVMMNMKVNQKLAQP